MCWEWCGSKGGGHTGEVVSPFPSPSLLPSPPLPFPCAGWVHTESPPPPPPHPPAQVEHIRQLVATDAELSKLSFLTASNAKLQEQLSRAAMKAENDRHDLRRCGGGRGEGGMRKWGRGMGTARGG